MCVCVCVCVIDRGIRGFHPFTEGINPKMNPMARLEFELSYYDVTVQHVNHCTTGTPPSLIYGCGSTYIRTYIQTHYNTLLLWTPTHGRAKARRPARTYIQQLCEDTGCCPEDLPRAMNDREEWRERVRDIRATSARWWWWWWWWWWWHLLTTKINAHKLRKLYVIFTCNLI